MPIPQPTGLEGTGASIGHIALNFINGIRQGRMQKYAMQEAEHQKDIGRYQHALQVIGSSNLPDEQKRLYEAKLTTPLIQNIAADKNVSSKKTGNPMTDVFKNMAMSVVGGNLPKKAEKLSMEPVMEAIMAASDPARSKAALVENLTKEFADKYRQFKQEKQSKGGVFTDESLRDYPDLVDINTRIARMGGPDLIRQHQAGLPSAATYQLQDRQNRIASLRTRMLQIPDREGEITPGHINEMHDIQTQLHGLSPEYAKPEVGQSTVFEDEQGNRFTGQLLKNLPGIPMAVYNPGEKRIVQQARQLKEWERKQDDPEKLNRIATESIASVNSIFKPTDGASPEEQSKLDRMAKFYEQRIKNAQDSKQIDRIMLEASRESMRLSAEQFRQGIARGGADKATGQFTANIKSKLSQSPAVKAFDQIDANFRTVQDLFSKRSQLNPQQQLEMKKLLINVVAKAADPISSVKEGELRYWGGGDAFFAKLENWRRQLATNTDPLMSQEIETKLYELASDIYSKVEQKANSERNIYRTILIQSKVPENLASFVTGLSTEPLPAAVTAPAAAPAAARGTSGGTKKDVRSFYQPKGKQ